MTKTSYEERGEKFARYLMRALFKECKTLTDYRKAVEDYNKTHKRELICKNGISRVVIVRADYVIKIEYGSAKSWAGGNKSEYKMYELAVKDGMAHLLAKPTPVKIGRKTLTIMPRIDHIRDKKRDWWKYCTPTECNWLDSHINDLHTGNVGYKRNKVCIVDYAFVA